MQSADLPDGAGRGAAPDAQDGEILKDLANLPRLIVLNKQDLPSPGWEEWLAANGVQPGTRACPPIPGRAWTPSGRPSGERAGNPGENALTPARHLRLARATAASLRQGAAAMQEGVPLDLCMVDLNEALHSLGQITGDNVSETLLDEVFASFCVGK